MIKTAKYAREHKIPYLGLCLGMQVMVIEFARDVFKSVSVNSTEFDPDPTYPVIDLMPDQKNIASKGHTMRLGNYPCKLIPGTMAAKAYQQEIVMIQERHRHRFEYNNDFRHALQEKGLVVKRTFPGRKPGGDLRNQRQPLDGRLPIPSRIWFPSKPAASAVP
jgi:CTP synthase